MTVSSGHTWRLAALPATVAVVCAALVAVPDGADAATPCSLVVTTDRTSSQTLRSGVQLNTYAVKVSDGDKSQSASVQRLVMPAAVKPTLLHTRLGWTATLRDQITKQARRAVAAVNGDFFYEYPTGRGQVVLPRGASVSDGTIVRADDEDMRVLGLDTMGDPYTGMLHEAGEVVRGKDSFAVSGVNWHWLGTRGVVVYTNDWASGSSAERPLASVEWLIHRGRIKAVRTGEARGRDIAFGTKVVAFGPDHAAAAKRAEVGDRVAVTVRQVTSTGVTLTEAVGRGAALVRDSAIAFSCDELSDELRPRTAVGWLATGRWATLIVPGTGYDNHGYRIGGLGLPQTATVAQVLGFASIDELDGGGSVTAYVRRGDRNWDRVDDDDTRWARPVPNGLAFVAS